jgi:hypothetical protein
MGTNNHNDTKPKPTTILQSPIVFVKDYGKSPIRATQNSFKRKSKQFRGKIVFIGWVYGELGR